MNETRPLGSLEDVIDFAIERERSSWRDYESYGERTDHQGLRALLRGMADQEKAHEQSLVELRSRRHVASFFSRAAAADIRITDYTVAVEFSPDMGYQDFLLLVIQREDKSIRLYTWLESSAEEPELKQLFKGLAEEERRHKALAQDRYDLEILTEN